MKTSVVIPATPGNFVFLNSVIENYAEGTVKPDEVVVSLSNAHLVSGVDELENRFSSKFEDFKVLRHEKIMVQGPNRDAATMATKNEIIISNDADDVPHPQRIEVIKHFFETQDILHLNHSYQTNFGWNNVNINDVKVLSCEDTFNHHFPLYRGQKYEGRRPNPREYGHHRPYGSDIFGGRDTQTHCGCPAFHREVFDTIRWRHTEERAWDIDFVLDVLFTFRKSIIIDSKLLWYNTAGNRRNTQTAETLGPLYRK